MFSEGFENSNFLAAEGWTTVQGLPANTNNQAVAGIASWDNNAAQSMPVAKKVITNAPAQPWMIRAWFYDNPKQKVDPGSYLKVKLSDGSFIQVGVRNSVSQTQYVVNPSGTYTDSGANFAVPSSPVNRSQTWHLIDVVAYPGTGYGQGIAIIIDGVLQSNFPGGFNTGQTVSEIWLQGGAVGDTGNGIGNFDSLALFSSNSVVINSSVAAAQSIYTNTNTLLTASSPTTQGIYAFGNVLGAYSSFLKQVFPLNVFFEINMPGSAGWYRTPLISLNPGDIYSFQAPSFGRKIEIPLPTSTSLLNRNLTNAGQQEVLYYASKDKVQFSIKRLQGDQWKQMAENWFRNAVQGNPFSLVVDDLNETALGVISAAVLAGTNQITIMPNMSTNPTDLFTANPIVSTDAYGTPTYTNESFYVLRDAANTQKQIVTVASKTGTVLTFNENLNFALNPLDYCYAKYLYPFMELGENDLKGFKLSDAQRLYYDWMQVIQEYNS